MRTIYVQLICAALASVLGSSHCSGGFLTSSSGIPSQIYSPINVNQINFLAPLSGGYQLELTSPTLLNPNGTYEALGGMYGNVEPAVAWIAIKDGSSLRLMPGTATSPYNEYQAVIGFAARTEVNYQPNWVVGSPIIDGPMLLSMQYSLKGYLATDTKLEFGSSGTVGNNVNATAHGQLQSLLTWTDPGYFEFNYQEIVPFQGFNVNSINGFYTMRYDLSVTLRAKAGAGESWAVLDPGFGTGIQGNNLFPWLPASNPVPEPSSWLLFVTGLLGVQWVRRRRSCT